MKTMIQIWTNPTLGEIRTMNDEKGKTWFVGKDVAEALGYKIVNDAIAKHVEDEDKGVAFCDTLGGSQKMTLINESGLYALVISSKLPQASECKHWVTSDVPPQIRKTEGYVPTFSQPLFCRQAAKDLQAAECPRNFYRKVKM